MSDCQRLVCKEMLGMTFLVTRKCDICRAPVYSRSKLEVYPLLSFMSTTDRNPRKLFASFYDGMSCRNGHDDKALKCVSKTSGCSGPSRAVRKELVGCKNGLLVFNCPGLSKELSVLNVPDDIHVDGKKYKRFAVHVGNGTHFASWITLEDKWAFYDGLGTGVRGNPRITWYSATNKDSIGSYEAKKLHPNGYAITCLVYAKADPGWDDEETELSGFDWDSEADVGDVLDKPDPDEEELQRKELAGETTEVAATAADGPTDNFLTPETNEGSSGNKGDSPWLPITTPPTTSATKKQLTSLEKIKSNKKRKHIAMFGSGNPFKRTSQSQEEKEVDTAANRLAEKKASKPLQTSSQSQEEKAEAEKKINRLQKEIEGYNNPGPADTAPATGRRLPTQEI